MSIKDILVGLADPVSSSAAAAAAALAAAHGARVTALHVQPERELPPAAVLQMPDIEQVLRRVDEEASRQARERIISLVEPFAVPFVWRDATGSANALLAREAQGADLVVVARDADGQVGTGLAAQLVLHSGRPVLLVPELGEGFALGRRVVVAWNGSREATRAVQDALPILKRADWVEVLMISSGPQPADDGLGTRVCAHLARHGVEATRRVVAPYPALSVDGTLLVRSEEDGADLVVMGAYGRSHLREVILGGITNGILSNCRVPAFISH